MVNHHHHYVVFFSDHLKQIKQSYSVTDLDDLIFNATFGELSLYPFGLLSINRSVEHNGVPDRFIIPLASSTTWGGGI